MFSDANPGLSSSPSSAVCCDEASSADVSLEVVARLWRRRSRHVKNLADWWLYMTLWGYYMWLYVIICGYIYIYMCVVILWLSLTIRCAWEIWMNSWGWSQFIYGEVPVTNQQKGASRDDRGFGPGDGTRTMKSNHVLKWAKWMCYEFIWFHMISMQLLQLWCLEQAG